MDKTPPTMNESAPPSASLPEPSKMNQSADAHLVPVPRDLEPQPTYRAPSLMPFGEEWEALRQQAQILCRSGFLPPALDTPEKVITVALTGREIGVPMMQAVRGIHVIEGKPSISAELMLSLAYQNIRGFKLKIDMSTEQACRVTASRPGHDPVTISFSIGEAERAGLTQKANWKRYPAAMLRARCISAVLRVVAPDACRGFHTPDEYGAAERDQEIEAMEQLKPVRS